MELLKRLLNLKAPDPKQLKQKLNQAINKNIDPSEILYNFLTSDSLIASIIRDQIKNYKECILLLTSKKGRKYIHNNLDSFLDYLELLAKNMR